MAPPTGGGTGGVAAAGGIPPLMVRKQKPGEAIEEFVSVRRLLAEPAPGAGGEYSGWARVVGDDGEEDREIAFSAGGRYVAVALQDGHVAVWDLHPVPHAALYLELPPQLTEEEGAPEDGYVVTGLSWSKGARKLLVTYRHRAVLAAAHICKWDVVAAAVEAHCKCPAAISAAQLSPADADVCAYFLGGNAVLRLQRLSDGAVVQEADLIQGQQGQQMDESAGGGGGGSRRGGGARSSSAPKDDESVASGSTSAAAAAVPSKSKQQQEGRLGLCVFGEGGRALFAVVGNRRVLKLEAATLRELRRSQDIIPPGHTQVFKMRLAPSGRLLFVFTNRAAHVISTASLRASEPLGEFGALKVEWGCWGVGPERNALPGAAHDAAAPQQLLVLGVPSAFSRDTNAVQERHFAWRVPDPPDGAGWEGEREGEGNGPLLRLEATPDIIPGFKTGFQALELCPGRALILGCGCEGGLYMRQETFTTGFPGPMYAPGYTLLENNRPYIEREDELDRLPPGSAAALAKEAELNKPSSITTAEDAPVDLSASPALDIRAALLPKPLPRGFVGLGDGGEDGVVFPLIMHQRSKRRKAEEEAGDGAESEEEQGGFRPYLPMPPALARRRKAQGKQGGGTPAGGGNAAVKAQRAVEEWAAKGREALKRRMEADLQRAEEEEARRKEAVKERRARERREEQEKKEQRLRAAQQAQQMQQMQQMQQGQQQQGQAVGVGGGVEGQQPLQQQAAPQQPPQPEQQQQPQGVQQEAAAEGAVASITAAAQQQQAAQESPRAERQQQAPKADDASSGSSPHEESKEGQGRTPEHGPSFAKRAPSPAVEGGEGLEGVAMGGEGPAVMSGVSGAEQMEQQEQDVN